VFGLKCENCRVTINGITNNCPLCGKYLTGSQGIKDEFYPEIKELAARVYSKNFKILLFLTAAFSILLFTINMITLDRYLWSIIPICAMWLLWLYLGVPIIKKKITPLMIVLNNGIVSIFLIIVDITTGNKGWAMSYVVSFILFGSALIVTIVALLTKITWKKFYLSQMTIVVICFIPLITRIFFSFVFWPSIVAATYGVITILGMLIFSYKKFKYETKKQFHF
jgi:hypothetical protein